MSSLWSNAVAGAVLASVLGVLGVSTIAENVLAPKYPEKPGWLPEVADEGGSGGAQAEGPPDFGTLFADQAQFTELAAHGQQVAGVCRSCHNFEAGGPNGTGPNLHDVFGRRSGTHPGFAYSPAMAGHGAVWSYDTLNAYLTSPSAEVPGNKMAFAGVRNTNDRVALIAYLRSIAPSLAPLPAPLPPPADAAPAGEAAPAEGAPASPAPTPG